MSLVDEVLAEHTSQNASLPPSQQRKHPWCEGPHEGDDGVPWPCESVQLALSLKAAEGLMAGLADEVLAEHVKDDPDPNWPAFPDRCKKDWQSWPCESARLATKLRAAEQVVEAARDVVAQSALTKEV